MAKTKKELKEEASKLGVVVKPKATIAQIQELINNSVSADAAEPAVDTPSDEEPKIAKAGKRSAKAIAETEEKQAKEERKVSGATEEAKPKAPVTPTRSRLERRGKTFRKNAEQIEKGKLYTVEQAAELAKKTSHVKFDATVELHINLGVDPRHADQNIRDNVVLPAGTGKTIRIAVLTDDAASAKKVGADIAGTDELLAELEKGLMNFDVLISTPALMPKLGKFARTLGPRGLMPNPKSGTVTNDISKAVSEAKSGRVEYRVDSTGIVHLGIGKVSFTGPQLAQNIQAVISSVKSNKPQSLKGNYFKAIYISSTMGPSISVDLSGIS